MRQNTGDEYVKRRKETTDKLKSVRLMQIFVLSRSQPRILASPPRLRWMCCELQRMNNQNIRHSSKGKSTSLFSYTSSKSDAQTNARMLHGILVFYVIITYFSYPKIRFQNLVCPKCAQIPVFHRKMHAEKASKVKTSEALILLAERVGFEPTVAHHHT